MLDNNTSASAGVCNTTSNQTIWSLTVAYLLVHRIYGTTVYIGLASKSTKPTYSKKLSYETKW